MMQNVQTHSIKAKLHDLASDRQANAVDANLFRDAFQKDVLCKKDFASALGVQPAHIFSALTNKPSRKIAYALSQLGYGTR